MVNQLPRHLNNDLNTINLLINKYFILKFSYLKKFVKKGIFEQYLFELNYLLNFVIENHLLKDAQFDLIMCLFATSYTHST